MNPYYTANQLREKMTEGLTYNDVQIVPQYCEVPTRSNIKINTRLVGGVFIDHPLIPANMDTISGLNMAKTCSQYGAACFFHRFDREDNIIDNIVKFSKTDCEFIGVSIGIGGGEIDFISRVISSLEKFAPTVVLIDVAHGDHVLVHDQIRKLKKIFPLIPVIAGNVATGEAARRLIAAGADGIKVGVGPGSLCSTRIETGAGVPQFTAVSDVANVVRTWNTNSRKKVTVIADGGIKYPGDIVKAIGAGADSVMSGYLFAGTDATPGDTLGDPINGLFKVYRGSASRESKMDRGEDNHFEGVATKVPFRGLTTKVFESTSDGIRSGLSYAGFDNLMDAIGNMMFVRVSQSSIIEAHPNGAI